MKNFILVLFSFVAVACSSLRQVAPSEKIITETRIETVYETDTVYVEIPQIAEKVVTKDTVSVLENEFAMSAVSVSDGFLTHSLETKPLQKPVKVQTKTVYRDSVIFKDVVVYETVEIEKELTSWQSFKMRTGGIALTILLLLALMAIGWIIIKILRKRA